jgi:hypothetical protein
MLAWLMDNARGEEKSPRNLTLRVLLVNFAAIHLTSMVPMFSYFLASVLKYIVTELHSHSLQSRSDAALHTAIARGGGGRCRQRRLVESKFG